MARPKPEQPVKVATEVAQPNVEKKKRAKTVEKPVKKEFITSEERFKQQVIRNIRKLKQVVAEHLMQHKMLVKRSLPFDSTFDSFRDAIESYNFGLEEIRG